MLTFGMVLTSTMLIAKFVGANPQSVDVKIKVDSASAKNPWRGRGEECDPEATLEDSIEKTCGYYTESFNYCCNTKDKPGEWKCVYSLYGSRGPVGTANATSSVANSGCVEYARHCTETSECCPRTPGANPPGCCAVGVTLHPYPELTYCVDHFPGKPPGPAP